MSDITLSSAVRRNLLTMQGTADMMAKTQNRLATGKRVNSALDNPTNFFTASALNSRSSDLMRLQDSVGNAVQTIEAADNGIKAITKLVESAQGTARQALQSTKPEITTFAAKAGSDVSAGAPTESDSSLDAGVTGTIDIVYDVGGADTTFSVATDGKSLDDIAAEITANGGGLTATVVTDGVTGQKSLDLAGDGTKTFTVNEAAADTAAADLGIEVAVAAATPVTGSAQDHNVLKTADSDIDSLTVASTITFDVDGTETAVELDGTESFNDIASKISEVKGLTATVEAGAADGEFKISITGDDSVTTFSATGGDATTLGIDGALDTESVKTDNSTRTSLESEYNALLQQIDELTNDASFNGNNFLAGDDLKVIFNETGTSSLTVKGVDTSSSGLGLEAEVAGAFQGNDAIEATLSKLDTAVGSLRSNASTFGSNLSTVQTRKDFTKDMINTLETGAANLTLADVNREGANMLALQTRQQLSTTALSMASQADQAVLRLF